MKSERKISAFLGNLARIHFICHSVGNFWKMFFFWFCIKDNAYRPLLYLFEFIRGKLFRIRLSSSDIRQDDFYIDDDLTPDSSEMRKEITSGSIAELLENLSSGDEDELESNWEEQLELEWDDSLIDTPLSTARYRRIENVLNSRKSLKSWKLVIII